MLDAEVQEGIPRQDAIATGKSHGELAMSSNLNMCIGNEEFREYVIRPTLKALDAWSESAENLLLATALQESEYPSTARQRSMGVYRINPVTHQNVWDKYLVHRPEMASRVRGLASQREFLEDPHKELTTNLSYATAIAWMIYERAEKPLPEKDDYRAMAKFWKRYYHNGKAVDQQSFIDTYQQQLHQIDIAA